MRKHGLLIAIILACLAFTAFGQEDTDTNTIALGEGEAGRFLTDSEGFSLYLFLNDTDGASVCYDGCAALWPPLLVEDGAESTVGEGLDAGLLGTTERTDGTLQVTYNGWPLYYYAADMEAGQTTGQAVGGNWWLVSAAGTALGMDSE